MADRDLLNKLLSGQLAAEGPGAAERAPLLPGPAPAGRLGVKERPREVGREQAAEPLGLPSKETRRSPHDGGRAAEAPSAPVAKPHARAHQAAYFNRDVEATAEVNPRTRPQEALRGSQSALDLKRVVLPPPATVAASDPALMGATLERMEPQAGEGFSLAGLIGRESAWSQLPTITAENIRARLAHLESLVALRRLALSRMRALSSAVVRASATLKHALNLGPNTAAQSVDEVAKTGDALIAATDEEAKGMRTRLRKVMRSKF